MNCPVCNFKNIPENITKCPECASNLSLVKYINILKYKIRKRNSFYILSFCLLVILFFIYIFAYKPYDVKNSKDLSNLEALKNENEMLKAKVNELETKIIDVEERTIIEDKENKSESITEYIVQKDDNLWIIAQKMFGDGHMYKKIASDNNIKKPYEILIGATLIIKKEENK